MSCDENLGCKGHLRVYKALFPFRADDHMTLSKQSLGASLSERNLRRAFGIHAQNEPIAEL